MVTALLATKLHVPHTRSQLVPRLRLIDRLNHGLNDRLVLISAPAGFGKTTLVTDWLTSCESPVAWLQLDAGDSDALRFLTYLIAALQTIAPSIGKGILGALQSAETPSSEWILTDIINDIATVSDDFMLVLDDYHLIDSETVGDILTFLLEHAPPQLHLVIATRHDPQLPLARLRARNQLTELRASDLRFSTSEAAEFLNQVMNLDLSTEDVAALEARTEGWITGLQLAAISMQGRNDAAGFIKSFTGSHRFVLDYLVEEVLRQQPENIQTFLLQTSILDQMTGPLCNALTGQTDGQEMLEALEQQNLFLIALDSERRWYRYHHLFADLLRQRLQQAQPDKLIDLHVGASEWFSHQGLMREAIKHSLEARDYAGAIGLIKSVALDFIQQGEHSTIVKWTNTLPEKLVKEQPYLCALLVWALQLSGQLEQANARLSDAENALESSSYQDEETDVTLGLIHSRRAYMHFVRGEQGKVISHAQQALKELPDSAESVRMRTAQYMGVAHRYLGQLQEALDVFSEILSLAERLGGKTISNMCYLNLGALYVDMAQLHQAKATYEQALQHTEKHTGRPDRPYSGYVYVSLGQILRQWNQLEDAYRYITKGVSLCRDWDMADVLMLSCIELAYINFSLGKDDQARAAIDEAIQISSSFSPWAAKYAEAHKVKLDLMRGDIDAADQWAQTSDLAIGVEFDFNREIEYIALARVLFAKKRLKEAYFLAEQIYLSAREVGRRQTELEGLMLLASISYVQNESGRAMSYLGKALSIGEAEGYIRMFVDEGPPMAALLHEALSRDVLPDYANRLLVAFPSAEAEPADLPTVQSASFDLIEPLSERELEVLELVAEGLTNREIAERLYLSILTVKVHARNIYGKLSVNNRMQAVTAAQQAGILNKP